MKLFWGNSEKSPLPPCKNLILLPRLSLPASPIILQLLSWIIFIFVIVFIIPRKYEARKQYYINFFRLEHRENTLLLLIL